MRLLIFIATVFCAVYSPLSHAQEALSHLNQVRYQAGLPAYTVSNELMLSASNHEKYLHGIDNGQSLGLSMHDETPRYLGFTGKHANDRAVTAGYLHHNVSENISYNSASYTDSIDALMSAIYHRFGFLSFTHHEIGYSAGERSYVYNMGRSDVSAVCATQPEWARVKQPVACGDYKISTDHVAELCTNLPKQAHFITPLNCPNGNLINGHYIQSVCDNPPAESISNGGRSYLLCENTLKVKTQWLDNLCENPSGKAKATGSSYRDLCGNGTRVDVGWYQNYCAALPEEQRLTDSGSYSPCENGFKMRKEAVDELNQKLAPVKTVIWPADGDTEVLPSFSRESPNPIPDYLITGYPVSIQFNPDLIDKVSVSQFLMEKYSPGVDDLPAAWQTVHNIRELNQATDPNKKFSSHEYAWFPLDRLDWDTHYRVLIVAYVDGVQKTYYSNFKTRGLPVAHRTITTDIEALYEPRQDYILYQAPTRSEPEPFSSLRVKYNQKSPVSTELIDANTVRVKVSGRDCTKYQITSVNGRALMVNTCQ